MEDDDARAFMRRMDVEGTDKEPPLDLRRVDTSLEDLRKELDELERQEQLAPPYVGEAEPTVNDASSSQLMTQAEGTEAPHDDGHSPMCEERVLTKATSAAKKATRATVDEDVRFPISSGAEVVGDDHGPLDALTKLCTRVQKGDAYRELRAKICMESIRLNRVGKIAPSFRPQVSPGACRNDPVYQLIHRDQQVVDLHWCHATDMSLTPINELYRELLQSGAEFDFDLAWALSGKNWKKDHRTNEALCLTMFQQCQLVALNSAELCDRIESIDKRPRDPSGKRVLSGSISKRAKVGRVMREWAEQDSRIAGQQAAYEQLWRARELLGAGASAQTISELHALMHGGEPLNRKSVSDKLAKLDRRLLGV